MALRYIAISLAGQAAETPNSQSTLATAVSDAIDAAETANASDDADTEIAAITTALTALTDNQPSGALVVTLDTSQVTTKNKLRQLLDAAYRHLAEASKALT